MKHFLPLLAAAGLMSLFACQPVEQTVAVTGVRVTPATLALTVGESAQLTATIEPKDATDQTITWSSSDDAIATVSDGKVTAIAEGSVTITAEAGGKKGTCSITVAPYVIPVTRISLDKESLELVEGEAYTLTATLEPEDATDQTVVWQSSDEGIATVEDGVVTAVAKGSANITALAGSQSVSCQVTVYPPYEYMDLGLSVLWATCNIGAATPEEYGDYFAWGEIEPYYEPGYAQSTNPVWKEGKSGGYTSNWSSYQWCNGSYTTFTKYCFDSKYGYNGFTDNLMTLLPEDDAASAKWSGNWRMQTDEEWTELMDNCIWVWTEMNGVNGYKVTSNLSGYTDKWIFLPAAGCRDGTNLYTVGTFGKYWSSSLHTEYPSNARFVLFRSNDVCRDKYPRYLGQSIRPVMSRGFVPVESISLNEEEYKTIVGKTFTLSASITPYYATDKTVIWSSSDENIATVVDGKVTAIGVGEATITASSPSAGISASCTVTVESDGNIVFADKNLEAMLVAAFDTDGDGGLSYQEAAEVTSLEGVFGNRKDFKSFDEFQYFTGVTTIEERLFYYWKELVSIVLPDSITFINYFAFEYCRSLTTIHIPSNVTSIIGNPFAGCSNLTCFTGKYASDNGRILVIDNCLISFAPAGLTAYSIPNHIIKIEEWAFRDCENLSAITIPNSVQEILTGVFWSCSSLATVHIPESVTQIDDRCFAFCNKLKQFTGKFATSDGRALVFEDEMIAFAPYGLSHYTVPGGVRVLGVHLFSGYSQIQSIKLPDGLERIPFGVFEGCTSLESINIPNSVTAIGSWAFANCCSLPNFTIPANVENIYDAAFYGCSNLSYIEMKATTPPQGGEGMFDDTNNCPIYVPIQSETAYKQAEHWSEYAERINPPYSPAVDMGLSVMWGTYNIGASSIIDYGDYYAWGELDTKWYYDGEHYLLGHMNDGVLNLDYYNYDDDWTRLKLYDDIAHQAWGGRWRMPTSDEYAELIDNCDWEWITINNIKGIQFTSRINGNSIFFPAGGLIEGTTEYDKGIRVNYWTSTKPAIDLYRAHSFGALNGSIWIIAELRTLGMPVRAVKEW